MGSGKNFTKQQTAHSDRHTNVSPPGGDKLLYFATAEWAPYIGSQLPGQGYVAKVVREALLSQGYYVLFDFLPWARAIRIRGNNKYAGYLPEYTLPYPDKTCLISKPFPAGPLALITTSTQKIRYTSPEQLMLYTIGVVQDYRNTTQIDQNPDITLSRAVNDSSNLKKLLAGRVDAIVGDPFVLTYLQSSYQTATSRLQLVLPLLEEKTIQICFNPTYPNVKYIAEIFDTNLERMRKTGRLRTLWRQFTDQHSYAPLLRNTTQ